MVNILSPELDFVFYALSDRTRRSILHKLHQGSMTVGEIASPFRMSLAAISKHIKILEKAKLLTRKKTGRIHACSINPKALASAEACISFYTKFWNENLDAFAKNLESNHEKRRK